MNESLDGPDTLALGTHHVAPFTEHPTHHGRGTRLIRHLLQYPIVGTDDKQKSSASHHFNTEERIDTCTTIQHVAATQSSNSTGGWRFVVVSPWRRSYTGGSRSRPTVHRCPRGEGCGKPPTAHNSKWASPSKRNRRLLCHFG